MTTTELTQEVEARTIRRVACVHGRIINDVLGQDGNRTGMVRCAECGTIFDDPCNDLTS
jgi:hypothetical protein